MGLLCAANAWAEPTSSAFDNSWRFNVIPYLWIPRISGTLNFETSAGTIPSVSITPIEYLDNLNIPLMLTGEARRGRWSIATDFVFVDFSGEDAQVKTVSGPGGVVEIPVDVGTTVGLRGVIWTLGGGYTVYRDEIVSLDAFAGCRYFRVKSTVDWRFEAAIDQLPESGSHSQTDDLWHGVVGIRGRVPFGDSRWFAPFHADVGTGSADLTWLLAGGVGYDFRWGDLRLSYRDMGFDADETSLTDRLHLTGPALGVGFRF